MNMNKHKVLIVDDERFNLNVVIDLLKSEYQVFFSKNGEQALNVVHSENPPDLILLDILMPDIDGYEVCKQLKANEKSKDIPVIFLTAKTDDESIKKAYK